jgi:hypothetical protein
MMGINVRQKGAEGERQAYKMMNEIVCAVMQELEFPADQIEAARKGIQRNQNQTAVGGCDLTNTYGIAFEIKRQETLSVPAWWRQTCTSAERNNEMPVLMYRQNNKPWRFRTYGWVNLPGGRHRMAEVEFDEATFKGWFADWVRAKLLDGHEVRT